MNIPPLCIIQARYHSTRLEAKMLQTLGSETLIARGYRIACEAFGKEHVVVAIPRDDFGEGPLYEELIRLDAQIAAPHVEEWDVLGRFAAVANLLRWHDNAVIVRYTPDDPFKNVESLRRVANGERLPVEWGGEAFTLRRLNECQCEPYHNHSDVEYPSGAVRLTRNDRREHITHAIFSTSPPPCPPGCWTIDTIEDLEKARAKLADLTLRATAPMVGQ